MPAASAWEYAAMAVVIACGALAVRTFARSIAPMLAVMRSPGMIVDALAPLGLMVPMLGACWRMNWDVRGAGWLPIGGPIVCGLLAMGCAAVASARVPGSISRLAAPFIAVMSWTCAGALLLLLGAAHDMTIWLGQCTFVAGATLLWINSPAMPSGTANESDVRASGGATVILLCGIVQAVATAMLPAVWLRIAGGIMLAQATVALALVALLASPELALRLGGWAATYGLLLGLGAISLRHLLPRAVAALQGDRGPPPSRVAFGFGHYVIEATILLVLGALALAIDRVSAPRLRLIIGMLLIAAGALLAGWRLASM